MKKFLIIVALFILVICTLFNIVFKVNADDRPQIGDVVILDGGYLSVCVGYDIKGNAQWQVDLSAPTFLDDKQTLIDTEWHIDGSDYIAGKNKFTANVSGEKATIYSLDNKDSISWQPSINIANMITVNATTSKYKAGDLKAIDINPTILNIDPINFNYHNNTLQWDYGNGVYRYLRLIEGVVLEYYVINNPVNGDFNIAQNVVKTSGIKAGKPIAWDADYKQVDITVNADSAIKLGKELYSDSTIKYPITIDPDVTFYSTSSDGEVNISLVDFYNNWATTRTSANALHSTLTSTTFAISTFLRSTTGYYAISRSALYFDTSTLPDSATITDTELELMPQSIVDDDNAQVFIVNGMSTYPHDPLVLADYNYTNYGSFASNYGSADAGAMSLGSYYKINTTDATLLKNIVNKTGYTKLVIVERHDYSNEQPAGDEDDTISFYSYEQGAGYRPKLIVTYSVETPEIQADAASDIAFTTARLNATVVDDGYESSQVRFGYGTTSQTAANFALYDTLTSWSAATWDTGEHPYVDLTSLTDNTTYYYRAQIKNTAGNMTSVDEISFTTDTLLSEPNNFRAYPSTTSINLSWVKGTGASQTMVRYSTTGYPATTTNGTLVYEGTASTTSLSGLVAGKTYYFSAWGESGGTYSSSYAYVATTTNAFSTDSGDDLETPSSFFGWFQATDYTGLSNLQPFYGAINGVSDSLGTPRNNVWEGLALIITALITLWIITKKGFIAGMVVGGIILFGFTLIHLVPSWMLGMMVIFTIFGWGIERSHGGSPT